MDYKKSTILYVDDNEVNLTLMVDSFKDRYHVITASSGQEGIEKFMNNEVSLVLADLMMPGMSGVEFLEKINEIDPLPPRLLLTAHGSFESIQEAVNRSRIYQYIPKPWSRKDLMLIFENALNAYEIQLENVRLNKQLLEKTQKLEQELVLKDQLYEKIRESEEKFYTIYNSSPDAIALTGLETGKIMDANNQFAKMMDLPKENVIGKTKFELGFWIKLEDRERFKEILEREGKVMNYEVVYNQHSKESCTALLSGEIVRLQGEKYILVLVRDISERKKWENEIKKLNEGLEEKVRARTEEYRESERKFRELLQFVPDGILLVNRGLRIVFVNDEIGHIFGYDKYDLANKNLGILFPKPFRTRLQNHFFKLMSHVEEKNTGASFEVMGMRRNNEEFPLEVKNDVILFEGEAHVIGIVRDISEKRESEEELRKAMVLAESANKTKSEFLANMSHEIRTPLNAVLGITDLLYQQIDDEVHRSYLNTIKTSSKSLLAILNDILDISKIEAGKFELKFGYFNPFDTLKELESLFLRKAKEKGVELQVETNGSFPNLLLLDEIRLKQILVNLLSNAFKFTDTGHVKLTAKVVGEVDRKEGKIGLDISVEDTGIGIDANFQERIFDEFSQQDGQDSKKYGGSGLGLAISNKLVAMMQGGIEVQSTIDKGSVFTVRFRNVKFSNEKKYTIQAKVDFIKRNFLPSTVVIVDSDNNSRNIIQGVFFDTAVSVFTSKSVAKAMELVKMLKPNLIIVVVDSMVDAEDTLCKKVKGNENLVDIPILGILKNKENIDEVTCYDEIFIGILQEIELLKVFEKYLPFSQNQVETQVSDKNNKHRLPENVRTNLRKDTYELWKQLRKQQKFKQVGKFSDTVRDIGVKFKQEVLVEYSNELNSAIDAFDIKSILKLLTKYEELIKENEY